MLVANDFLNAYLVNANTAYIDVGYACADICMRMCDCVVHVIICTVHLYIFVFELIPVVDPTELKCSSTCIVMFFKNTLTLQRLLM